MNYIYIYNLIKDNKLKFTHVLECVRLLEIVLIIMEQHIGKNYQKIKNEIIERSNLDFEVELKSLIKQIIL